MSNSKPVVLLSGGLDSCVLLAKLHKEASGSVSCVSFDYGQRHASRELDAARRVARHYGLRTNVLRLAREAMMSSALTGVGRIPHAHYADPIQKATVVPNRNMVMLSVAASMALTWGGNSVCYAAHAGDAAIYPDCRRDFFEALATALHLGCGVNLFAPFLDMTKRDVVHLGRLLDAPLHLTWSCYEGGETPCGGCGACCERAEALA